jgi:glycosyltransferase involved in cell wall biosynthesis
MVKPKIMLVGPWRGSAGGVRTFMMNVIESELQTSHEFLRFNTARPAKPDVVDNYGYRAMFRGGIRRILAGAIVTLSHLVAFPFVLALRRPDIVQIQSSDFQTFWESALYVLLCQALGFPVMMRLGGAFDNFYLVSSPKSRAMIRWMLGRPDRLIVQSGYWRDTVERLGRREGVVVLANCVRNGDLAPARSAGRSAPVCLFMAGSEAKRKGLEEVLAAVRILEKNGTPVRIHILAATQALREQIETESLSHVIEVEGFVSREQMLATMRQADIFLLPSRAEGFPNALLEAMASGAAVIVTPVGSIPEIVGEDCALIVPVNDAPALAAAIERLGVDEDLRWRIARAGRDRVAAYYSQDVVLRELATAWHSLLSPAGPPV